MRVGYAVTAVFAAILAAACAAPTTRPAPVSGQAADAEALKQSELAFADLLEKQRRLTRVHYRLVTRAHAFCEGHVGPEVGLYAMRRPRGALGEAAARLYGVGERPTVLVVVEGGPAEAAGLRVGDVLRSVAGTPVPDGEALEQALDKLVPEAPIAFEVERAGAVLSLPVAPARACRYPVLMAGNQAINAFADGRHILVTAGMVGFAAEDRELALVVAHEMAHNAMRHGEAKKQNAGLGLLADFAVLLLSRGQTSTRFARAGAMVYSQEFEAEADYVGLYMLASAGYPIEGAPLFWRRMAAAHPGSIKTNHAASHPSTAHRMVALEGAVREIQAKVAANEPLRPNLKDGTPALSAAPAAPAPSAPPALSVPAMQSAPPAPSAQVALAAPSAAAAPPAPGLPAAGTSWTYYYTDRLYRGGARSLTVTAVRVEGELVDERLLLGSGMLAPRTVLAHGAGFVEHRLDRDLILVEFAPYHLAANGERAHAAEVRAESYPRGPGNPHWIARLTRPPSWEVVTVPAGTFNALRLDFGGDRVTGSLSPQLTRRFAFTVWYAPEARRYVRIEQKEWTPGMQATDVVIELAKFGPPS